MRCCERSVYDESAGWWCPEHGDEEYAELRYEHLAAADLDPNWPAQYE